MLSTWRVLASPCINKMAKGILGHALTRGQRVNAVLFRLSNQSTPFKGSMKLRAAVLTALVFVYSWVTYYIWDQFKRMSSTKCGSGGGWLEGVISALCLYSSDWFTHLLLTLWWIQALATFSHQRNRSGVSWTDRIPNKTVATYLKVKKKKKKRAEEKQPLSHVAHVVSFKCLEDPAVQCFSSSKQWWCLTTNWA